MRSVVIAWECKEGGIFKPFFLCRNLGRRNQDVVNEEIASVWKEDLRVLHRAAISLRHRDVEEHGMIQKRLRIELEAL